MLKIKHIIPFALLLFGLLGPETMIAQQANWDAPEEADELENPLEPSGKIVKAGNQIYQQLCAVCHGKSGAGDGITAASLNPKPADLKSSAVQDQSEGALFWKINNGRPPMPAFENQLSEKQIWALVTYIKSLDKQHSK